MAGRTLCQFALGDYFAIPLSDGTFGYGRQLSEPYHCYYDIRTERCIETLAEIREARILFRNVTRVFPRDRWRVLFNEPLGPVELEPTVNFRQSVDGRCVIYDSAGMSRSAEPEECVGLERAAVWEAAQIAERLLDHFEGRQNETLLHSAVRFPQP